MLLLAVPNISTGEAGAADTVFTETLTACGVEVLDTHHDRDHGRSVYSVAGGSELLPVALAEAATAVAELIDISDHDGAHPHAGAVDVAPIVYPQPAQRSAALATALALGHELGSRGFPVFLYGVLGGGRTRAELRRGGSAELIRRVEAGELRPDFGPTAISRKRGATLVAARPPLIAFNLVFDASVTLEQAKVLAAKIREGGDQGLSGVRAIGLELRERGVVQLSTNIEEPVATTPTQLLAAVKAHLPVVEAELVGLAPAGAFDGFPPDIAVVGFDPERSTIERRVKLG